MQILRLGGPADRAGAVVDGLLREYLRWGADRFAALGLDLGDPDEAVERHHQAFRAELPKLLGPRGRLLVATVAGEVAGAGALKPVDAHTGEIKRMYVRPAARGHGAGRALLERLLSDARGIGYRTARLETATFMTEAQALYRSLGFRDVPMFDGAETTRSGLDRHMRFMALDLSPETVH
jgi:GNAT superfamily N-acetyltransferase